MASFDYAQRQADLTNQYSKNRANAQVGNFLGQQQYGQQKDLMNKSFTRNFPKFTGQWAKRLGSGIRSGVFENRLTQNVNDYNQGLGQVDTAQAQAQGAFQMQQTEAEAAYRRALQALLDDQAAQQAAVNPFAAYQGVYGG